MALVYSAPSCARLMAMQSLMPFQWQGKRSSRSSSSSSSSSFGKAIKAPIPIPCIGNNNNSYSFSSQTKKLLPCVRVASTPHTDVPVVTEDTWDEYVLNSDIPVLVEFWAAWCGPCRMVHREMEEIAREYTGRIKFYMLKADEDFRIANKYDIKVVPVVVLFKNGEKCDFVTGTMPNYVYTKAIEKLLSS